MEKAFGLIDPMMGKCIRYDFLHPDMKKYYEAGKIIQWNRFTSSFVDNQDPSMPVPPAYMNKHNTVFHIYSQTGRNLRVFSTF